MNHDEDDDSKFYRYVRGLNGLEPVDSIRRCGKLVPRYEPESRKDDATSGRLIDLLGTYREIMYGLTRLQRRTFLLLLLGWTLEDVATFFGVSREAIYSRIRGRDGHSGMTRNDYVAYWWKRKRKVNQHE
jgi:hypothetical protein